MRPASFLTLQPGTPVVDRFGHAVGTVDRVLVLATGGFDGIVVKTDAGTRFVDAPEVRRISAGQSPSADELADRVGIAHLAETLDELDAAVEDVSIS